MRLAAQRGRRRASLDDLQMRSFSRTQLAPHRPIARSGIRSARLPPAESRIGVSARNGGGIMPETSSKECPKCGLAVNEHEVVPSGEATHRGLRVEAAMGSCTG